MELLWDSFVRDGVDYPSPNWHETVLAARKGIIDSNEASWLTVDELQARLMSR